MDVAMVIRFHPEGHDSAGEEKETPLLLETAVVKSGSAR